MPALRDFLGVKMNKKPQQQPLPVYDREKDGNPFQWIIQQATAVRASRDQIARLGCVTPAVNRKFRP